MVHCEFAWMVILIGLDMLNESKNFFLLFLFWMIEGDVLCDEKRTLC